MNGLTKVALHIHRRKTKTYKPCNAVWTGAPWQYEELRADGLLRDDTLYFIIGSPAKEVPARGTV